MRGCRRPEGLVAKSERPVLAFGVALAMMDSASPAECSQEINESLQESLPPSSSSVPCSQVMMLDDIDAERFTARDRFWKADAVEPARMIWQLPTESSTKEPTQWDSNEFKTNLLEATKQAIFLDPQKVPCDRFLFHIVGVISTSLAAPGLQSFRKEVLSKRRQELFPSDWEAEGCSTFQKGCLMDAAVFVYSMYEKLEFPRDWITANIRDRLSRTYPNVQFETRLPIHYDCKAAGEWSVLETIRGLQKDGEAVIESGDYLCCYLDDIESHFKSSAYMKNAIYIIFHLLPEDLSCFHRSEILSKEIYSMFDPQSSEDLALRKGYQKRCPQMLMRLAIATHLCKKHFKYLTEFMFNSN